MAEGMKIDGRVARGRRTRSAIVTALLDLIGGGDISPSAKQIAERANVSLRSVYQHFNDVEGLYEDASTRIFDWVLSVSGEIDPQAPLEDRVEEFAATRAAALEMLAPFNRATRLLERSSPAIRRNREAMRQWGRDRLNRIFSPELSKAPDQVRQPLLGAIDALSSSDAWEHLRTSGSTVEAGRRSIEVGVAAMLASVEARPGWVE
ncbi:MAG: TetR/AcrR family transcriptional regulator [Acidimicrobiales bacterium]